MEKDYKLKELLLDGKTPFVTNIKPVTITLDISYGFVVSPIGNKTILEVCNVAFQRYLSFLILVRDSQLLSLSTRGCN